SPIKTNVSPKVSPTRISPIKTSPKKHSVKEKSVKPPNDEKDSRGMPTFGLTEMEINKYRKHGIKLLQSMIQIRGLKYGKSKYKNYYISILVEDDKLSEKEKEEKEEDEKKKRKQTKISSDPH